MLYDPRRPTDAEIDSFWHLWGLPAIFCGFGLILIIVGGGVRALRSAPAWPRLALQALVVGIVSMGFPASPAPMPQDSERVLVENPRLTQSMVYREIAVCEFFFDIKLGLEQRRRLQQSIIEIWQANNQEMIPRHSR